MAECSLEGGLKEHVNLMKHRSKNQWFLKEGQIENRPAGGQREVDGRLTGTPWEPTLGHTGAHAHLKTSPEGAQGLPSDVPEVVGRARMLILLCKTCVF